MSTMADKVAELADKDGQTFTDEFEEALEAAPRITYVNQGIYGEPVRYEWGDGSAIVVSGDFWYMGVHASRFEEVAQHFGLGDDEADTLSSEEPILKDGVEFALVDAEPRIPSYWAEPKGEEPEVEGQPSSSPA